MKLVRAHFKNFRLLKDLELDFSIDQEKRLTVIRAANETGKTTCQYGLMWALFGSKNVLRKDYTLSPKDLITPQANSIEVSVEIEFIQTSYQANFARNSISEENTYRLRRSCTEKWRNQKFEERQAEETYLYKVTPTGTVKIANAEKDEVLNNALPVALKDVYFTDGDSALAFIEAGATQGVKRNRVSRAVESLLGLEVLRQTCKHMNGVSTWFGDQLDNTDYKKDYELYSNYITSYEEDIEEASDEIKEVTASLDSATTELKSINTKIEEILSLGDKAKLLRALKTEENGLARAQVNQADALKNLSWLVGKSLSLSQYMLRTQTDDGLALLNQMSQRNQLPKLNIPILQELLERNKCLCDEDLSPGSSKRTFIENSITASRESDAIQDAATSLYYSVRSQNFGQSKSDWLEKYNSASQSFINLCSSIKDYESNIKNLNQDIANINDSNLQMLRDYKHGLENAVSKCTTRLHELEFSIKDKSSRKADAESRLQSLVNKIGKADNVGSCIHLSRRVSSVFDNIIEKLKKDEIKKVSEKLNKIFLDMIGAKPELNGLTVITRAELTEDYDIVVYGPRGNKLDPDQDLNGASRRAITLAFILALTKVSEVEAPNVIDTPLGMMAGYVKQSVLKNTVEEGTQTVLFLTHDEINGVEALIDKYAGKIFTLTNPAHYPQMLVNKIDISDSRIVRCECDHRHVCPICERKFKEV